MSRTPRKPKKKACCRTKFCRGKPAPQRRVCEKCRKRQWREKHPIRSKFIDKKANAKRRKIPFALTLQDFERFCLDTGYHQKSGRTAGAMSIDRPNNDHSIGYRPDNIQALTVSQNSLKWHWRDRRTPGPDEELQKSQQDEEAETLFDERETLPGDDILTIPF